MDYFPAFLALDGKSVLIIGGGKVAFGKLRRLIDAGASVTMVAPETVAAIDELEAKNELALIRRRFRAQDVDGHWLVVNATGNSNVAREAADAANRRRIFCNSVDDIDNCSYITPAIVDRSPILVAISSAGTAPVLARRIRKRIEVMLPARLGRVAALAGRWRNQATARLKSFGQRLRFWEAVFAGDIEEAVYTGRDDLATELITKLLKNAASDDAATGHAWLVGAGPGDPELLTLKALQAMQRADVILHDRLVSSEVLALARRDADVISVGKTPGCAANNQESTNALLVKLVAEGKRVCRLKGGDPFIFGRGGEEAEALARHGLSFSVVPGITAAAGCAAAAGIPLTHRDLAQSLVLVTGHGKQSIDTLDWPSLARERQTLAVYMGVRRFSELMQNLTKHGRSAKTPIAIIENGTREDQRVVRGVLGQLPMLAEAHAVSSPAILIIGEVAALDGVDASQNVPTDAKAHDVFSARTNSLPKSAIQRA